MASRLQSPSYDTDRRGRRFEDDIHVAATAPRTHEAASQPAEREVKALCPDECLHVKFCLAGTGRRRLPSSRPENRRRPFRLTARSGLHRTETASAEKVWRPN